MPTGQILAEAVGTGLLGHDMSPLHCNSIDKWLPTADGIPDEDRQKLEEYLELGKTRFLESNELVSLLQYGDRFPKLGRDTNTKAPDKPKGGTLWFFHGELTRNKTPYKEDGHNFKADSFAKVRDNTLVYTVYCKEKEEHVQNKPECLHRRCYKLKSTGLDADQEGLILVHYLSMKNTGVKRKRSNVVPEIRPGRERQRSQGFTQDRGDSVGSRRGAAGGMTTDEDLMGLSDEDDLRQQQLPLLQRELGIQRTQRQAGSHFALHHPAEPATRISLESWLPQSQRQEPAPQLHLQQPPVLLPAGLPVACQAITNQPAACSVERIVQQLVPQLVQQFAQQLAQQLTQQLAQHLTQHLVVGPSVQPSGTATNGYGAVAEPLTNVNHAASEGPSGSAHTPSHLTRSTLERQGTPISGPADRVEHQGGTCVQVRHALLGVQAGSLQNGDMLNQTVVGQQELHTAHLGASPLLGQQSGQPVPPTPPPQHQLASPVACQGPGGGLLAANGVNQGVSTVLPTDVSQPLATSIDNGMAVQAAPAAEPRAATVLQEHVQRLAVQASFHGQAKELAEVQVQQLVQQATLHAQASAQAAVQAEQLKKTLAVLPESDRSTQQATATVESLEVRAQAHAEGRAQAEQMARQLQEQAQAHAQEQAKAIAQATMLEAQARTLQVTAQQASEVQPGQALPALALPNGTDAPAPLAGMSAQAAAVAQVAQSTLSGGGPPQSLSLGGPSDVELCQELGLLPISPLRAGGAIGRSGAGALAVAALPSLVQAQPAVVQPASQLPAQPAVAAIAAQAPMGAEQQVVLGGQQQAVGGTLVSGTTVVNVQHATTPTSQVQPQRMLQHSGEQASIGSQLTLLQGQVQQQAMANIQAQLGLNGGSADASAMLQQQQSQQQQQQCLLAGQGSLGGQSSMVMQSLVVQPSMGGQPSLEGQTSLGGRVSLGGQPSGPSQEQLQDQFPALQEHQQALMAAEHQQHVQLAQLAAQQQAQLAQEYLAAPVAAQDQQHQQLRAAAAQLAKQIAALQQHQR